MFFKRANGGFLLGLCRFALFVLGSCGGVFGSILGLTGTQGMSGHESAFEIPLGFGTWHTASWGLGGLIVAAGSVRGDCV